MDMFEKGSFGYDLDFLKKYHPDLVLLSDEAQQAQLIVLPAYQGRAMTSTLEGDAGASFGWVNHELIASGSPAEHMHVFGGEDRFWMGPEGGQFSIFFKKGVPFDFEHWFVPKELDTEPFNLIGNTRTEARLEKTMRLENYSGTVFDLAVQRNIRLLDRTEIEVLPGFPLPENLKLVCFESENMLTNTGKKAWDKDSGLLSIWIASMLNASPGTTVAIPYRQGDEQALGKIVTDHYFGKIPPERLQVADGLLLFRADGQQRGKLGIAPSRAFPVAGAWDAENEVLTLAQFSLPAGATDFVNALWEFQDEPFAGDVINSYNDGPNDTGTQMGAFYELESSSPAAALQPGASIRHLHRTMHLKGSLAELDEVAQQVLGAGLSSIQIRIS